VFESVVCQIDSSRIICKFIGKGFLPCLFGFAIMDFLVLPWLRRAMKRQRHKFDPKSD
jgi:hypothetical protein